MCILIKIIFKKEDHHPPSCSRVEKSRNYLWFLSLSPPLISILRPNYFHILSSSWSIFATLILKQAPRTCPQLHTVPTGLLSNPAPNLFYIRTLTEILFKKSLLSLLQCCFCLLFWFFDQGACGISAPQPGMETAPPALERKVPTPGPLGKFPKVIFLKGH